MTRTTSELRRLWGPPCSGPWARIGLYGEGVVVVRAAIIDAVRALDSCLVRHDYATRRADTGGYNCRPITGGTDYSLHAYAIAIDLNWQSNPYGPRLVTDMPPAMITAIKAIRTRAGTQVWRWGGDYSGNRDAMHFEVIASPTEIATGIDPATLPALEQPAVPLSPAQEEDVLALIVADSGDQTWWVSDGVHKRKVVDGNEYQDLRTTYNARTNLDGTPIRKPRAWVDGLATA